MARRQFTVKRIDPWSVLKVGAIASLVITAIAVVALAVIWFMIDRLRLVDQVCGIATDIGFATCGLNAGNFFRATIMLGLLWAVVQTAVFVFLAFLYNLMADLTGGVVLGVVDENDPTPADARSAVGARTAAVTGAVAGAAARASERMTSKSPRSERQERQPEPEQSAAGGTAAMPRVDRPRRQVERDVPSRPVEREAPKRPAEREAPSRRRTEDRTTRRPPDDDQLFGGR
ncbi:MAG: DUF3566 domain-containing protein [Nitriliruptoraceae bacterium]